MECLSEDGLALVCMFQLKRTLRAERVERDELTEAF